MSSAYGPHELCMVGLYETGRCISVHLVVGNFGLSILQQNYWEGLVVDCLPAVDYCLGSEVGYS